MKRLQFKDYKKFVSDISDKYKFIKNDDYNDVAVVAKYDESRKIIKELLCVGYDLHSIEIHDAEWDGYDSEYIVSLYDNEIWCEPILRDSGYITDDSPIMYVLDNCSSKVIPYCKGKTVYEVSIGYEEDKYNCDNCELDECIRCGETKSKDNTFESNDKNAYTITIKCNLDTDDAEKIIADMERRAEHINDMFAEMNMFRRMFRW